MRVTLVQGERRVDFDASDVPDDSLVQLASAALNIVASRSEARVVWSLEPARSIWSFRRVGALTELSVCTASAPDILFSADTPESVARVIWRGLRRLEAETVWEEARVPRVWAHPFPHGTVAQLGEALGRRASPMR